MTTTDLSTVSEGFELPPLEVPAISRTTLALFAGGSGDHNPIHIDVDFAKNVGMPDVFAHGMLSMAYLGRLLTQWVDQSRIKTFEARFASITPVGAAPRCTGVVTSVYERDGKRWADIDVKVTINGDQITVTGVATVDISTGQS